MTMSSCVKSSTLGRKSVIETNPHIMFFHFQKYNHKQTGCVDGLSINRGEELWWSTLIIGAHNTKNLEIVVIIFSGKISLLIIPSMSNFPWSITRHPRQIQFHKTSQIYTMAGLTGLRRHNGAKQHQKKTYWYSTQTCTKSQVKASLWSSHTSY